MREERNDAWERERREIEEEKETSGWKRRKEKRSEMDPAKWLRQIGRIECNLGREPTLIIQLPAVFIAVHRCSVKVTLVKCYYFHSLGDYFRVKT